MSLLERLTVELLENKDHLRRLEALIVDVSHAADVATSLDRTNYLTSVGELRDAVLVTRRLIDELEKRRTLLRKGE